jgi:uncharacterized damage-inducible protein DinB
MVRLEAVLDSWKTVRQDTAQAVRDCPAGEFDFRPAPELMSFREIARHILNAGLGLTGLILDGEVSLASPGFREKMKPHFSVLAEDASASDLAAELISAMDRRIVELSRRSPEFYAQMMTRFDGQELTRLEMLQSLKEHELTHRAQLFMYLRLKGVVPVTTRRRLAQQAAR